MAGRSIPLLCLEGVPDLHGAPQDEANLTKKFETNSQKGDTFQRQDRKEISNNNYKPETGNDKITSDVMKDIKKYDKEHWGAVSVDLNMAHVDGILENGISKNEQLIPTGELGPGRAEVNPAGQVLV